MDNPMAGNRASEKTTENFSETWGKLISYCQPYLLPIGISLLASVLGSILTLLGPNKLSELTDLISEGIMTGIDLEAVSRIGLFLVIIYGLSVLLSYTQGYLMVTVTQEVSKKMRQDISQKINRLPLKYFDTTSYGDILSRVTNDVDTISQSLNQGIGNLVSSGTMLFGAVIMMFVTNWAMALVAILSSLIGFAVMILIISRSQKYFGQQQSALGAMNGHVEEVFNGHNIVKVYNAEKELGKDFFKINNEIKDSAWKSQFLSGLMMPLMSFIGNLGYVAVCVAGAALVINGSISFGVIIAFMVYIRLFTQPLSQIAQAATSLQSTGAASYRVFEFLEEEELSSEENQKSGLGEVEGNVAFKHVSFGYTPEKTIIHDFSASVRAGKKIAIVGPTGAGKTTIVNLLMKFYEVSSGEITIDGVPISRLTRAEVHQAFCMVLQDTWLFEGTIRENIVYCKEGISNEEISKVCKAVGIHHFIMTLPQGYDTVLDENTSLSAGQKQLVTIARAMIEDAPMLILDEATSSVDTRTEILIQQAMDQLMLGRTSFVIAHRLSTIKDADLILVMNEGKIIEQGSHNELLSAKGFYADLYNSQFSAGNL